jgi:3-oxoacyl-[acyl-carrier protein] reductase
VDLGLKNRVAIVAAASKGLGRAAAFELAKEGARVVICSRKEAEIGQAATDLRRDTGAEILPMAVDVTRAGDIERLVAKTVETWGAIDILVNNAGGPPAGQFMEFDDGAWLKAFELTLLSVVRLCRAVIPHMKRQGSGRIINITSTSVKQPIDELLLSNSIRPGVIGLAKSLSLQLARDGITVNNVCPGRILTQRTYDVARLRAEREGIPVEEIVNGLGAAIPIGRLGKPEELGALIAFLASGRAAYITGTTIQVDGGIIKGLY